MELPTSRLTSKRSDTDSACISAFRREDKDGTPLSRSENRDRSLELLIRLQSAGFGVTAIKGSYREKGARRDETTEEAFFVESFTRQVKNLIREMCALAKKFEQDSVFIIFGQPAELFRDVQLYKAALFDSKGNLMVDTDAHPEIDIDKLSRQSRKSYNFVRDTQGTGTPYTRLTPAEVCGYFSRAGGRPFSFTN